MDSFCFNLGTAGIDPIHFLHLFFFRGKQDKMMLHEDEISDILSLGLPSTL